MSKTVIYPICLVSMIVSAILYQVKGNPRDKVGYKIEVPARFGQSTKIINKDATPTIMSAVALAEPLLKGEKLLSVNLHNGIWSVTGTEGRIINISKATGEVLEATRNR